MKRRSFVAAMVTGTAAAVSGCIAGDSGSDARNESGATTDEPTDGSDAGDAGGGDNGTGGGDDGTGGGNGSDDSGGGSNPSVANTELTPKQECGGADGASVEFVSDAVTAVGCIQGPNGCHVPKLQDAAMSGETLRITVTTEKEGGADTACTQAIVDRGYEATVSLSGGMPATVEVVHVAMGETKTVATVER
ncbi:hypothetical protein ACFO0N_10650 [Halobium salinum]|uniref:Secreted protein n=1 Tax=Halobium salinum TaxID=1364940 RepID=A0ABD5PCD0_9EURY|nr:hypothetical protein [Halobium salinum]